MYSRLSSASSTSSVSTIVTEPGVGAEAASSARATVPAIRVEGIGERTPARVTTSTRHGRRYKCRVRSSDSRTLPPVAFDADLTVTRALAPPFHPGLSVARDDSCDRPRNLGGRIRRTLPAGESGKDAASVTRAQHPHARVPPPPAARRDSISTTLLCG